jgi:hypothetical protein
MKKRKAKLHEKIRNRPKGRKFLKEKKKSHVATPQPEDVKQPDTQPDDESMEVMSQVIMDFAAPLLENCNDEASEKKAVSVAIYVWNTAMLPEKECRQILDAYVEQCREIMPPEELKTLSDYIDQLVQTRKTRYGHNRNKIVNCTFGNFGADRHIEVGYTLE